jgi:hypothetical protein
MCTAENGAQYRGKDGLLRIAGFQQVVTDLDPESIMIKNTKSLRYGWKETTYLRPATAVDIAKEQDKAVKKLMSENKKYMKKNEDLLTQKEELAARIAELEKG